MPSVLPMFFLSGALYPVESLPPVLRHLTLVNPLSYGVDSFKHIMLSRQTGALRAEFPLSLDIIIIGIFALVMTLLSSRAFERR